MFFTWTYTVEWHRAKATFAVMTDKDGDLCRVPTSTDEASFSAHAEPYRPSPVVDLFEAKPKP